MNCNQIHGVLSLLFIVLFGGVAHGAVVLQPPGLVPGDQYRLVFVTSTTRNPTSSNIDDYNAFVQAAADASPLAALGTTWRAIGSTSAVDADVNTGTQQVGVNDFPIFRVDGVRVAIGNADLWDGTIEAPINITDHGLPIAGDQPVWTGTRDDGKAVAQGSLGFPQALQFDEVAVGYTSSITSSWVLDVDFGSSDRLLSFYALSAPITVPVPEPSSCALMGMAIAAWASGRRRSKKSQGSPPAVPNA